MGVEFPLVPPEPFERFCKLLSRRGTAGVILKWKVLQTSDAVHPMAPWKQYQSRAPLLDGERCCPLTTVAPKAWFILLCKVLYVGYGQPSP